MSKIKRCVFIIALFFSMNAVAASLGDWSNSLMGPVKGLGHVLNAMCFVAGIGFLLGGLLQYKYHRENPQQVRLSTPLILLFLGAIIIAIPIIAMLSESGRFLR